MAGCHRMHCVPFIYNTGRLTTAQLYIAFQDILKPLYMQLAWLWQLEAFKIPIFASKEILMHFYLCRMGVSFCSLQHLITLYCTKTEKCPASQQLLEV